MLHRLKAVASVSRTQVLVPSQARLKSSRRRRAEGRLAPRGPPLVAVPPGGPFGDSTSTVRSPESQATGFAPTASYTGTRTQATVDETHEECSSRRLKARVLTLPADDNKGTRPCSLPPQAY